MPLSGDILLDSFSYLDRYCLDKLPLVCRRFRRVVNELMPTICLRPGLRQVTFRRNRAVQNSFASGSFGETSLRNASSRTSGFEYMIEYSYDRVVQLEDGDALTEDSSKSVGCSTLANAFRCFVGICRSSIVKGVTICSIVFDEAHVKGLAATFRTMKVGKLTLDCQTNAVEALEDALSKLLSLDSVYASDGIPASVLTSDLLRSLAQKNASSVALRGGQTTAGVEYDVLDDALIEFLFRPHHKKISVNLVYANISSEFTSKLLQKLSSTTHKDDVDLQINEFDEAQDDAPDFLQYCKKEPVTVSYTVRLKGRRVAVLKHGCTDVSKVHFLTFEVGASNRMRF